MSDFKSAIASAIGLTLILVMSGCDKKVASEETKAAALVNGQAIAAAQIEAELQKIGQIPPEQSGNIANRILKNVVDLELLAQKAVHAKLDSQADVQMKIAAARRQILAEAQMAALVKDAGNPSEAEIQAYFDGHPELFAKRAVYRLQELLAGTTPENIEEARKMAGQARSPRELAAALQAKGIPVGGREMVKNAEDLPSELLAKLSGMKAGQSITLEKNGKLNLIILADVEQQPVTLEKAKPVIVRSLTNMKKRDLVEADLKKLESEAKIEYKAPYAAIPDVDIGQAKQ
ncbi:MAG: peptidyl-prolyl cis-trans isomerase, EpsD family [Thiobacillus sp.]|nr:peptidyl-prolyl cis-trans isomerase, EpsD family [Thiobacillus sp.]